MKNKILFVISLLFGLMFINAGLNKFLNYMPMPEEMPASMMELMGAFMKISWLMPLIGVVEIIGGLLFVIPKTRALGAIVILPIMVGIMLTHIINQPSGLPLASILMAVNVWVIYENRAKYLPMVK